MCFLDPQNVHIWKEGNKGGRYGGFSIVGARSITMGAYIPNTASIVLHPRYVVLLQQK